MDPVGAVDLDSYFARIGYAGPREPDLKLLRAIHSLHPAAIPFENLDPLLGRPTRLDLDSLQAKLIHARRGGYCFEQNGLLRAVLEALGYAVTPLAARVRWMAAPDSPHGPRSHMLMRVDLEGEPWLVDVAFGGHIVGAPLKLEAGLEQQTPAGLLRLTVDGDGLILQTRLPSGWQDVYRFTGEPAVAADYEVSNWYTSTHPNSLFCNILLAERLTPQARYSLMNRKLTERRAEGTCERMVGSADELGEVLERLFGIQLPDDAAAAIWARIGEA